MSEEIISRKDFFRKGFLKLFHIVHETVGDNLGVLSYSPVRPPGAIAEKEFLDTCIKCGKCVDSCEQQSIRFAGIEAGFLAGFPVVVPSERPCFVCDDLSCMNSCPSGALNLTDKFNIKMGLAVVNTDKCITHQGEECNICVISCPFPGEAILIDPQKHPQVNQSCIGCGLCEYWCDYNAILVKSER
jgi:ferredoxin-type protein NapG